MSAIWARGASSLRKLGVLFGMRRERGPIDTVDGLSRFVATRSAFVAQKKLYGYLKARMGTRYPGMFEDDVFVQSINVAKLQVFSACLADLSLHAAAKPMAAVLPDVAERRALALACYETGVAENVPDLSDEERRQWRSAFEQRLANVHWENLAAGADAFAESPDALVRWAPIADELKRHDREIVENSIRFAWIEIVRELHKRLAPDAVAADSGIVTVKAAQNKTPPGGGVSQLPGRSGQTE